MCLHLAFLTRKKHPQPCLALDFWQIALPPAFSALASWHFHQNVFVPFQYPRRQPQATVSFLPDLGKLLPAYPLLLLEYSKPSGLCCGTNEAFYLARPLHSSKRVQSHGCAFLYHLQSKIFWVSLDQSLSTSIFSLSRKLWNDCTILGIQLEEIEGGYI